LGHEGMGLGVAAKDTKEREEVVHVACSICLEAVKSGGNRSTARLQCGHEFHLGLSANLSWKADAYFLGWLCHPGGFLGVAGLNPALALDSLFPFFSRSGSRAGATSSSAASLVPPYLRNHGNIHERYRLQTSQSLEGTAMLQPGSSRGFNPLDQCGPFLVSPAIPLGQTAADAENMGSNRLCAWERECFASHHPYSRVDRECSCWGPFPPAIGASDSNPRMAFFPPIVPEIPSSQAGYNRSLPPARMMSLM
ncbi:hypothetical protein GW17_00001249, partial [Ensete ventricosum]